MNNNFIQFEALDNIVYLSILYDFYGELLSSNKKKVFEDYYLNDLSLSEIAKVQGISRQGIYDTVKRTSEELRDYENRLSLVGKFQSIKSKLDKISDIADEISKDNDVKYMGDIKTLVEDILKEL